MNSRRIIGNVVSTALALLTAVATLYLSIHYLAKPHGWIDWMVQLSGAATTAIIIFFLTWGHFQKTPAQPMEIPK
jgi:ABC-type Fe3+-siderophore transport system permease subunit